MKYIPGNSNFVPDMLSRNPLPTISAIKSADVTIDWEAEQTKDQQLLRVITDSSANFVQEKNIWYRVVQDPRSPKRNRLLLVVPSQLQQEVIRLNHDPLFSGRLGAHKSTPPKLLPRWVGPFRILNVFFPSRYDVGHSTTIPQCGHLSTQSFPRARVKHHFQWRDVVNRLHSFQCQIVVKSPDLTPPVPKPSYALSRSL
ncbi:hypothetical protein K450DRAFT_264095 [Umbelopsis ramanniana AG]|uniref:Uncharacterized protein n=1 Tax=Umbelopsis ramanniana AG TaxID=1314678 RepID=A0AAD5DZ03_UMBRA|nr:uncharacterized protein K450DRAFT_264095 [Umbelopsis ramanniana AG]KAI8574926.1 hypothetical protein K450DRAFT_264095 [Umbelopsis ramanniana AG]